MSAQLVPVSRSLTSFKLLSFDVFGTLIDWEGGMSNAIMAREPFKSLPKDHELSDRNTLMIETEKRERAIQLKDPTAEYADVLAGCFEGLVEDYNLSSDTVKEDAKSFGMSVGEWPVFPDTLDALERLKKHYYLVPLTNSSPSTFGASLKGPFKNFPFSAVYLATEIGSYKPDLRNFEYLFRNVKETFGVEKDDILHVAQSLHHDHAPAKKVGLTSAWISRKGASMGQSIDAQYAWRFNNMGEFADAVDEAWAKEGK